MHMCPPPPATHKDFSLLTSWTLESFFTVSVLVVSLYSALSPKIYQIATRFKNIFLTDSLLGNFTKLNLLGCELLQMEYLFLSEMAVSVHMAYNLFH